MHKRTKALAIPPEVKERVWHRDHERCIICGSRDAAPVAHFIPRSHGGLGVEQNIVTLCGVCHYNYDNTTLRRVLREVIKEYLKGEYPNWDEKNLYYKKEL